MTDPKGNYYRTVPSEVMADACEHNKLAYALLGFGIFSYMSADEANRKMALDWREKELPEALIINPGRQRHGFLYFELPEGNTTSEAKLSFVVESLESRQKFPFEIALPKTSFGLELAEDSSKKVAYTFNPEEPWTGMWKVEGLRFVIGQWGLKQSGSTVVSTKDSLYEIEGRVVGNQFKGKIKGSLVNYSFKVNISSDGQSFKGTADTGVAAYSGHIKGSRQE